MYTFNDDTNIHISSEQWQHMVSRIERGIHTPEYFEHESITIDGYGAILQLLYAARSGYALINKDELIQHVELGALELSQTMIKQGTSDPRILGYITAINDMLEMIKKELGEADDS